MSPRSSVAPVVASGTASVVKLLVATLAFTGAYAGVETSRGASAQAPASAAAQAQPVTLSSKSMPATTVEAPAAGTIAVSALTVSRPCHRPYLIQSVVDNPRPDSAVSYGWRLQRWSTATRTWRTYLTSHSGFAGRSQTAEWQPSVVDNPGWYRAELSVSGGTRLRSAKFLVSC
ncbi:hypothetical protein [Streptosporangium roseum]|uniref:Uncharacterized protein n=1 Tax=Streptosporangium roseum (strain ATCC 12428 / DSM 43021 / JCM 3005 / KCTC 9067 / NCIMB 10171 / NRRL 2505 / NI 9100) TaxID=479432 RepID=D2ARG6_STRRD|nr:hypothetical protein [Streptosporangium roseum]ACZ90306.1 hypothetical protein Sros_7632 [Streptosporangium roseum DSM 43021]